MSNLIKNNNGFKENSNSLKERKFKNVKNTKNIKNVQRIVFTMFIFFFAISAKSYAFTTDIICSTDASQTVYGNKYAFQIEFGVSEVVGFSQDDISVSAGKISTFTKLDDGKYFVLVTNVDPDDEEIEISIPGGTARTTDGEDGNEKASLKIELEEDRLEPELYLSVVKEKQQYEYGDEITIGIFTARGATLIDATPTVTLSGAISATLKLEVERDGRTTFNNKTVGTSYSAKYTIPYGTGEVKFSVSAKDMAGNTFNKTPLGTTVINVGRSELTLECSKNYAGTKITFTFNDQIKTFDKAKILVDGVATTGTLSSDSTKTVWTLQLLTPLPDTTSVLVSEGAAENSGGLKIAEKTFSVECSSDNSEYRETVKEIKEFQTRFNKLKEAEDIKTFISDVSKYYTSNKNELSVDSIDDLKALALKTLELIKTKCLECFNSAKDSRDSKQLNITFDKVTFAKYIPLKNDIAGLYIALNIAEETFTLHTDIDFKLYDRIKFSFDSVDLSLIEDSYMTFTLTKDNVTYKLPSKIIDITEGYIELLIEDYSENLTIDGLSQLGNSHKFLLKVIDTNNKETYKDVAQEIEVIIAKAGLQGIVPTYLKGYTIPYDNKTGKLLQTGEDFEFNITTDGASIKTNTNGSYFILRSETPLKEDTPQVVANFTDVPESHWAKSYIDELVAREITNGLTATTFGPSNLVTRSQAASFLVRARGYDEVSYTNKFSDIENGKWYTVAVLTAASNEIITGYKDGTFKPQGNLTRQEMIAMIMRAYCKDKGVELESLESDSSSFTDSSKISSWAASAVGAAKKLGIVSGDKNGNFNPLNSITRAEVAKILIEYLKLVEA